MLSETSLASVLGAETVAVMNSNCSWPFLFCHGASWSTSCLAFTNSDKCPLSDMLAQSHGLEWFRCQSSGTLTQLIRFIIKYYPTSKAVMGSPAYQCPKYNHHHTRTAAFPGCSCADPRIKLRLGPLRVTSALYKAGQLKKGKATMSCVFLGVGARGKLPDCFAM